MFGRGIFNLYICSGAYSVCSGGGANPAGLCLPRRKTSGRRKLFLCNIFSFLSIISHFIKSFIDKKETKPASDFLLNVWTYNPSKLSRLFCNIFIDAPCTPDYGLTFIPLLSLREAAKKVFHSGPAFTSCFWPGQQKKNPLCVFP